MNSILSKHFELSFLLYTVPGTIVIGNIVMIMATGTAPKGRAYLIANAKLTH